MTGPREGPRPVLANGLLPLVQPLGRTPNRQATSVTLKCCSVLIFTACCLNSAVYVLRSLTIGEPSEDGGVYTAFSLSTIPGEVHPSSGEGRS